VVGIRCGCPAALPRPSARCAFAVIQGIEHEEMFDTQLNVIGEHDNHPGDVTGLAPPGDIYRVRNAGAATAISLQHLRRRQTTLAGHMLAA
jgi:hypothetical protein